MFLCFGMEWIGCDGGNNGEKRREKQEKNFPKLGRFGKNAELCKDLQIGFCYWCGQADGVQKSGICLGREKTYHEGKKSGRTGTTELRQGLGQRRDFIVSDRYHLGDRLRCYE